MGKRGKHSRGGRIGRGRGGAGRDDRVEVVKHNTLFEKYYGELLAHEPSQKEEFWGALRRELPASFRFTGSKSHALQVQHRLRDHYIPEITSIEYEGQLVDPPRPLPWFPSQLAWQMTTPKNVIRRFPPFASFQKFLVSETAVGNISRQEAVSMIPPLLLDVKPGMTVLDLCAAPGSKSAQLIEMVHGGEEARIRKVARQLRTDQLQDGSLEGEEIQAELRDEEKDGDWADDGRSTGLLIANDVDWKRANLLVHQMKRLNSPNLLVSNHDATFYPSIKLKAKPSETGKPGKPRYLKFDRILADVPCSGDGTPRKNPRIWQEWKPANAIGLHSVQVRILVRSLQMLKVGGRVVYSTCSMNPVENEAVVAAAIDRCGGMDKVDLLDCSSRLPELKRQCGLKTWKVMGKDGRCWSHWEETRQNGAQGADDTLGKISESCFPSTASNAVPLERCLRIYAHHQDTGAFFIAVLEKKAEIRVQSEDSTRIVGKPSAPISAIVRELNEKTNRADISDHLEAADKVVPSVDDNMIDDSTPAMRQNEDPAAFNGKKRKLDHVAETPNKRIAKASEDEGVANERIVHYPPPPGANLDLTAHKHDIDAVPIPQAQRKQFEEPFKYLDPDDEALQKIYSFYGLDERFPRDRFLVRNEMAKPVKKIYYTTALSKEILEENEGRGFKFVHVGVIMFVKQEAQAPDVCRWRIQIDGLPIIEPWINESRVMRVHSRETMHKLLIEMFPKVTGGGWTGLGEIGQTALAMTMGCSVLRVEIGQGKDSFSERMVFPIWRSMHSLNLMLPKDDRKAMLLRLYNDESPLYDFSKNRTDKEVDNDSPDSTEAEPAHELKEGSESGREEIMLLNEAETVGE